MSMCPAYVSAMCAAMCVAYRIMGGVKNVLRWGALRGVLRCAMTPVLGAMTLKNDLLGQMRTEWIHVGHSSRARSAMATLAQRHQDLDLGALNDLYDVVTLLEAPRGRKQAH